MLKAILTLVFLLCSSALAQLSYDGPDRWLLVGVDSEDGRHYVEYQPRQLSDDRRAAWGKLVKPDGSFLAFLDLYDCSKGAYLPEKYIQHDSSGKVTSTFPGKGEWRTSNPGSIGDAAFRFVCKGERPTAAQGNSLAEILARTPPDKLQWSASGDPDSTQFYIEGLKILGVHRSDDLVVAVGIANRELDAFNHLAKTVVTLFVINDSKQMIDVLPDSLTVQRLDKGEFLKRQTAKEIGGTLRKRAILRSMVAGGAAGASQQITVSTVRGTVYTSEGAAPVSGTVVTVTPDREAQRRANQQAAVWGAEARAKAGDLAELEAKAETLASGETYRGSFYFDRVKTCDKGEIRFKLAGTEFVFPVSW